MRELKRRISNILLKVLFSFSDPEESSTLVAAAVPNARWSRAIPVPIPKAQEEEISQ